MSLKTVAEQKRIKKYVRQFIKSFKPFVDEQIKVRLGHQGASFPAKISWSNKLGVWTFSRTIKNLRYWNAFGMGKPQAGALLSITAEINFPWSGIDRKTGAAFAEDHQGNIFVIHRGKIGGGKKGIGKSLFENHYRGVWSFMEDGKNLTQVAVIGALDSARIALQIACFVKKIDKLKSAVSPSSQTEINFSEGAFHEDLVGSLPSAAETNITARCDHDLVVGSLADQLRQRKFKVGNDGKHELFLIDQFRQKISHFFEVVTDDTEESILAAAARLLLHKIDQRGNPLLILILPAERIIPYACQLQNIGISAFGFRLEEDRIIFPDLGKIRLDQNLQL